MPIYDRESDNARVYHFGEGDIAISHGKDSVTERWSQLLLSQGEAGDVGRHHGYPEGTLSTELKGPLTVMAFETIEGLDVLIERAQTLRGLMVKDQRQHPAIIENTTF